MKSKFNVGFRMGYFRPDKFKDEIYVGKLGTRLQFEYFNSFFLFFLGSRSNPGFFYVKIFTIGMVVLWGSAFFWKGLKMWSLKELLSILNSSSLQVASDYLSKCNYFSRFMQVFWVPCWSHLSRDTYYPLLSIS